MKTLMSLMLACLLLLGLASCAGTPAGDTDTPTVDEPVATPDEPVATPDESVDETYAPVEDTPTDELTEDPAEGTEGSSELEQLMMDTLLEGVTIETSLMNGPVESERFSWYFGIEAAEGYEGYGVEPLIGSIPLSIALLKLPEDADAAAVAEEVEANVDARKWICVEAEQKVVLREGQYILVILADATIADGVSANFEAHFAS